MDTNELKVSTIVSARTGEALVVLQLTGMPESVQVTASDARKMAMNILQAAEAAEIDSVAWAYFRDFDSLGDRGAAAILDGFRKYREKSNYPGVDVKVMEE